MKLAARQLAERGDYVEAEVMYLRALYLIFKTLSEDDIEAGILFWDLAELEEHRGRCQEAQLLYERARQILAIRGQEFLENCMTESLN